MRAYDIRIFEYYLNKCEKYFQRFLNAILSRVHESSGESDFAEGYFTILIINLNYILHLLEYEPKGYLVEKVAIYKGEKRVVIKNIRQLIRFLRNASTHPEDAYNNRKIPGTKISMSFAIGLNCGMIIQKDSKKVSIGYKKQNDHCISYGPVNIFVFSHIKKLIDELRDFKKIISIIDDSFINTRITTKLDF